MAPTSIFFWGSTQQGAPFPQEGRKKSFKGFRFQRYTLKRLLFLDSIYPDICGSRQQADGGGKATAREVFPAAQRTPIFLYHSLPDSVEDGTTKTSPLPATEPRTQAHGHLSLLVLLCCCVLQREECSSRMKGWGADLHLTHSLTQSRPGWAAEKKCVLL